MNRQIEIREDPGGNGKLTLEGYASRTETPYEVLGFTETIRRGAFKRSLKEGPDTSLLVNHEGLPIARTTAGTLALAEDENGLHVRAQLEPEDPDVKAIAWKMRSGALSEMSMGFRATKQSWNEDRTQRVIQEVALHRGDVSIVSAAASPTSTATLRSMEATLEQRKRMVERIGDRLCGPVGFILGSDSASQDFTPRGRAQIAVPANTSSTAYSQVNLARAHLAKGEHRDDATSPFGPQWAIQSSGDVAKAVRQVELGRARGNEAAIRAWIMKRAGELGASSLIPSTNWSAARSRRSAGSSATRRSHVEIARARMAKGTRAHPGSNASVEGDEDKPRYTDAQIQKLGEEGKALKKPGGGYHWPIADGRDVSNAVKAFGRAKPSEREGVRAWIVKRARILAVEGRLPESWSVKSPTPATVGTES